MSAVKGNTQTFEPNLKVGLTEVKVVAINPTRDELNQLYGREAKDTDKEIVYTSVDQEGVRKVNISVYLEDVKDGKLYNTTIFLADKDQENKERTKYEFVNSTCSTTWAADETTLPKWFTHFVTKDGEVLGDKIVRIAKNGEKNLAQFMRAWLGQMKWYDPSAEVDLNINALFEGDVRELKELIGDIATSRQKNPTCLTSSFVVLLGVRTVEAKEGDEDQNDKQYQAVYAKDYLPFRFIKFINNGFNFPNDYDTKIWNRFKDEVEGDYGCNFFFKLVPLEEYNKTEDHIANGAKKQDAVTATNADY